MLMPRKVPPRVSGSPLPSGKPVTSHDVARLAGVSQSAVSRCFTPGASISPQTRARIMKAVESLGYQPNAIARSLITKRSNLFAIIVANLGFSPEFTAALSEQFAERGLNVLLFTLRHEADADRAIDQLWQYRVDGVISAAQLSEHHIGMLAQRSLPVVFLNRPYEKVQVNSVCCDQVEGERWLVTRLVQSGHRRFAVVAGPGDSIVSQLRVASAIGSLRQMGIDAPRVIEGDFTYDGGRAAIRNLMRGGKSPDAVICANDMMAIGCIDEARHALKLRVPRDLSVVGFDGSEAGSWQSYDLTTIRQPTRRMAEAAIDMLLARVENPGLSTEKRFFPGELIVGSSAKVSKG